jgi:hypothetical protein
MNDLFLEQREKERGIMLHPGWEGGEKNDGAVRERKLRWRGS